MRPPPSLMYAKLSPVGPRAAYVRKNNLYVEDLRDGRITPLTHSKSPDEINGTFDWVYEEEFGLRDGFRWSPDGETIAYWNSIHRASASTRWSIRPTRSIPASRQSSTPRSVRRTRPAGSAWSPRPGETRAGCRWTATRARTMSLTWNGSIRRLLSSSDSTGDRTRSDVIVAARQLRSRGVRRDCGLRGSRRRLDRPSGRAPLDRQGRRGSRRSSGSASGAAGGTSTWSTLSGGKQRLRSHPATST